MTQDTRAVLAILEQALGFIGRHKRPALIELAVDPQVITDQLEQMDALVASWLPGSEGAGVAVAIATTRFATARAPASIGRSNYIP